MLYYGGVHMETIYEWLYENYYKPHAEEILDAYGDMGPVAEEAEQLLLAGEGDTIARQDAINALRRINGTAAFAAGAVPHDLADEGYPLLKSTAGQWTHSPPSKQNPDPPQ